MYVRNENFWGRLERKPFPIGEVRKVTPEVLEQIQYLISRGELSLHETDPSKPKKKPRTRKAKPTKSAK